MAYILLRRLVTREREIEPAALRRGATETNVEHCHIRILHCEYYGLMHLHLS